MKSFPRLLFVIGLLLPAGIAYGEGGTLTGKVTFVGTPPAQKPFPVPGTFSNTCGREVSLDRLIVGKGNGVANSLIYIVGLKRPVNASATHATFVADQKGCHYVPHVLVVAVGDSFTATNSDETFHNVHGYMDANHATAFNVAQPGKDMKATQRVKQPGVYQLRCDVHPWMNAYVFVSGNGFAAVTGEDGSYTLSDVPPGTYKLTMWHEGWNTKIEGGRPVFSDAIQQTQEIVVTLGKTTTTNFSLK